MTSLIKLTASDNEFTFLPDELFDCPALEVLVLLYVTTFLSLDKDLFSSRS